MKIVNLFLVLIEYYIMPDTHHKMFMSCVTLIFYHGKQLCLVLTYLPSLNNLNLQPPNM